MIRSLSEQIRKSRLLLGNQYAYLDGLGGYSALPHHDELKETTATAHQEIIKEHHHSHIEIEQRVRDLHKRIWRNRNKIWPNAIPTNPIDMLDPVIALKLIGYDCDFDETLGQFYSDGKLVEVAGTIDKSSAKVCISRQFKNNIRNFTAAHELGHALLHQTSGLHRDKPLDGATISRNPIELEADKFATFFIMPAKLVKTTFEKFFLTDKFFLNEETAFALGLGDFMKLKEKVKSLRQLSKILANAEQYNGLHFASLANQFQVSTEAMAIRLEELELLAL